MVTCSAPRWHAQHLQSALYKVLTPQSPYKNYEHEALVNIVAEIPKTVTYLKGHRRHLVPGTL